jgi:ribonuclease P/MRP protein subunit RPP1
MNMSFFDLHMHSAFSEGESSLEQLATAAKQLGYKGICLAEYYKNDEQIKKLKTEIERIKQKAGIEIFLGFEARNLKELNVLREKRKRFDVLLVRGGDLRLNREAVETPEVDILTHPEFERQDCGMNHILMKAASKNNVAIEINFREVLVSSKRTRSMILRHMTQNIKLAKKFKAPIIVCSGALSHWDVVDPQCLISFVNLLGLELNEAKNTISKVPEKIIKQIKERKSEDWIVPGVKVVK